MTNNIKFIEIKDLERKWEIEGYPFYFVAQDKQLYHIIYEDKIKLCKLIVKGYSKGYILDSKFITLTKLRTLLRPNIRS